QFFVSKGHIFFDPDPDSDSDFDLDTEQISPGPTIRYAHTGDNFRVTGLESQQACDYIETTMREKQQKIPNPREIEKEISDFLSRKYGDQVKIVSPIVMPQEEESGEGDESGKYRHDIDFDLKPEELIKYLDQYIIRQDAAKQILATKICTHFNRIRYQKGGHGSGEEITGGIKNNVLMIGPTGVGKTYMIKLIAQKLGVPFVKGDATKFSETGYVGGDVEDLVRDLVRESDNDIDLAQYGIIYIDEIDKIASSQNWAGADVSRTGVQRALLKPMEETEVEMKVPHDPISMIQEVEQFKKTGKRERKSVNTKNILFIMSGAFGDLTEIIKKRTTDQSMGFGAKMRNREKASKILQQTKAEDIIEYGFESEFVGRLPVKAVFEELRHQDLLDILRNPNNPVILNKRMDFATYGIDIKFSDDALTYLAEQAQHENTGARGLVSVIEQALIPFETHLPSTNIKHFPVTMEVIRSPEEVLSRWLDGLDSDKRLSDFDQITNEYKGFIKSYLKENRNSLASQYGLPLSSYRIDRIAEFYCNNVSEIGHAIKAIKSYYDQIKRIEIEFYSRHEVNIVLEEDAVDFMLEKLIDRSAGINRIDQKLSSDFEYGLKLIREKTGRNRFFISRYALENPETFLNQLIKSEFNKVNADMSEVNLNMDGGSGLTA
ncbi:MAG: AAA family ATPase, partial [Desulfobacterales bacterium]